MANPQDAGIFSRQVQVPAAAVSSSYTRNPKHMPLVSAQSQYTSIKSAAATVTLLSAAGSFTPLALGGAVTVVAVADTYVTVCDLTGGGFLTHVIGANFSAAHTPTFRITMDGTEYVIAPSATLASFQRMILGSLIPSTPIATAATATTIKHLNGPGYADDAGFNTAKVGGLFEFISGANHTLPTPYQVMCLGLAKLRFDVSLKVEVKDSDIHATSDPNRGVAALYLLDL